MVSSFYPVFAAAKIEQEVESMCREMDLKVQHHFADEKLEYYVLVDANDNHVDVVKLDTAEKLGLYGMRINVSDFEAGIQKLEAKGLKTFAGPLEFPKFIYAVMQNPEKPNGSRYLVYHHKKG